jgi:hypothetical protein
VLPDDDLFPTRLVDNGLLLAVYYYGRVLIASGRIYLKFRVVGIALPDLTSKLPCELWTVGAIGINAQGARPLQILHDLSASRILG